METKVLTENKIEVHADGVLVHTCEYGPEAEAVARQFKKQAEHVYILRYENGELWDKECVE